MEVLSNEFSDLSYIRTYVLTAHQKLILALMVCLICISKVKGLWCTYQVNYPYTCYCLGVFSLSHLEKGLSIKN